MLPKCGQLGSRHDTSSSSSSSSSSSCVFTLTAALATVLLSCCSRCCSCCSRHQLGWDFIQQAQLICPTSMLPLPTGAIFIRDYKRCAALLSSDDAELTNFQHLRNAAMFTLGAGLISGHYRVPYCTHLRLDSVLPQFSGCEQLTGAVFAESGWELACQCASQVLNVSSEVAETLEQFRQLMERIYFESDEKKRLKESLKTCQSMYKDWLCSVMFKVHRSSSDASTRVSPCPEWCQSVETECPYLVPSDDLTNSGEPVFLCHEDSYKGASRSDRCTSSSCCCYERASAKNRSEISFACVSQTGRQRLDYKPFTPLPTASSYNYSTTLESSSSTLSPSSSSLSNSAVCLYGNANRLGINSGLLRPVMLIATHTIPIFVVLAILRIV